MKRHTYDKVFLTGSLVLLFGCGSGGGSSSGTVSALSVPEQMSLVDANGSGSQAAILQSTIAIPDGVHAATGTDYDTDQTRFWVHDDSMEALDTINMILCSIKQSGYDDPSVLNAGPYVALVGCEERGGNGGGQGRGGDQADLERFVVRSSRTSSTSPHIVDFWIEMKDQGDSGNSFQQRILYGKLTIEESPSVNAPNGKFTMRFKELLQSQNHDDPNVSFYGYLKTVPRNDGQSEFTFYMSEGDPDAAVGVGEEAFRMRAHLVAAADGTTGRAYAERKYAYNSGSGTQSGGADYRLQFNANYLARKKVAGGETIQVFDRNNFTTTVFRYGLYHATSGARVDSVSGFGVETLDGRFGWAGYYGLWFPDGVTITNGQQLIRRRFDPNTANESYTAVIVPGRLEKRTRKTITLGDVKNEDLESFDMSTGTQILVQWDGIDLVKVANTGSSGWTRLQTPVSVSSSYSVGDWVNLYSMHRGAVQFTWPSGGLSDAIEAHVWQNSTITANSAEVGGSDLTLYGYHQMLKAGITQNQANFANSETPYHPDALNVGQGKTYVFDAATMMLKLSGSGVKLADGVTVSSGPGMWGFESGPMFTSPLSALSDMSSQTTQYTWTTGSNEWNQLRALTDVQGNVVAFTAPLRLDYTHNEPSNTQYHGRTFMLEWQGTDLHGIPYTENTTDYRWYPEFTIPSGTVLTSSGNSYKVKQLEGEQQMVAVSDPNAVIASEGFDLSVTLSAPAAEFVDPAIGAMPEVTAPPKFVGGKLQTSN